MREQLQPWFSPNDSVEALELLEMISGKLRALAQFGTMRKALRDSLYQMAIDVDEFVGRNKRGVLDPSIRLALEAMAERQKASVDSLLQDALEAYISRVNRKRIAGG